MVLTADQQRVKSLLTETITLLCKNGLHFKSKFCIEGLIGITLDGADVFLVSINETIQVPLEESQHIDRCSTQISVNEEPSVSRRNGRKRRKSSSTSETMSKIRSDQSEFTGACLEDANKWQSISTETGVDQQSAIKLEMSRNGLADYSNQIRIPDELDTFRKKTEIFNSLQFTKIQDNQTSWNEVLVSSELPTSNEDNSQVGLQKTQEPMEEGQMIDLPESDVRKQQHQHKTSSTCPDNEELYHTDAEVIHVKEETVSEEELTQSENSFAGYLGLYGMGTTQGCAVSTMSNDILSVPPSSTLLPGSSSWNRRQTNRRSSSPHIQQQVELVPGTGVYISYSTHLQFQQDQMIKGSKLVRRLVHELFPDERVLATSSCLGKRQGTSHTGLDQQKVDAIKAFVQHRLPQMSHSKIVLAINECCRDARTKLRRLIYRELNAKNASIQ